MREENNEEIELIKPTITQLIEERKRKNLEKRKRKREEEEMMEQAGYPLTEIHKGVHCRFVDKVTDLAIQHRNGGNTLDQIMHLLENWLFSHIRMNDHGYVPTVEKARVAGKL